MNLLILAIKQTKQASLSLSTIITQHTTLQIVKRKTTTIYECISYTII
jgi:hypothetical protein